MRSFVRDTPTAVLVTRPRDLGGANVQLPPQPPVPACLPTRLIRGTLFGFHILAVHMSSITIT